MSLLIRGGRILSGASPALTRADVLIDGDRIAAVGPALTAPEGSGVIDADHHAACLDQCEGTLADREPEAFRR